MLIASWNVNSVRARLEHVTAMAANQTARCAAAAGVERYGFSSGEFQGSRL